MKKFLRVLGAVLALTMLVSLAACGSTGSTAATGESGAADATAASDFKIGAIMLGDETEGYSAAHITGIKTAAEELGLSEDQIVWKYKIPEGAECLDAAEDLVAQGCDLILSNSYGHQTYMVEAAEKYPDVTFIAMTGDFAAISGLDNFKNAFTAVYQSRYVSGVVAGMKLKELIESGTLTPETQPGSFDADGNVKIGYVGAFPYAEVVSGYTAFYLGAKSVWPQTVLEVMYTNSWFDIDKEGAAAEALIANGAVIVGQHADSTGAPSAVQAQKDAGSVVYSVGYNIDMLEVAPTAALTSSQNNWSVLYRDTLEKFIAGEEVPVDYAVGITEDAVMISDLGPECAEGTQEAVDAAWAGIKDGSLKVFDTSTFTCQPAADGSYQVDADGHVTSAFGLDSDGDFVNDTGEAIVDGAFQESVLRSAPYFSLRIDGITELNNN